MITKLRIRTCRNKACRVRFPVTEHKPFAVACSIKCEIVLAKQYFNKLQAVRAKKERADIKVRKEAIKTRTDWLRGAQTARNAVVRERDRLEGCISCDKPATWGGQWHASHYLSVGSHPSLRFDMANIHKSCSVCNDHLSGNRRGYEPRIIAKIGQAEVDRLESSGDALLKMTIDEIKAQIASDRAWLREMVASRELEAA